MLLCLKDYFPFAVIILLVSFVDFSNGKECKKAGDVCIVIDRTIHETQLNNMASFGLNFIKFLKSYDDNKMTVGISTFDDKKNAIYSQLSNNFNSTVTILKYISRMKPLSNVDLLLENVKICRKLLIESPNANNNKLLLFFANGLNSDICNKTVFDDVKKSGIKQMNVYFTEEKKKQKERNFWCLNDRNMKSLAYDQQMANKQLINNEFESILLSVLCNDSTNVTKNIQRRSRLLLHQVTRAPNIDDSTHSFNVLLGKTPFQQRIAMFGIKLFSFTNTDTRDDFNYIKHDEIGDMTTNSYCKYTRASNEIFYSTSTATLQRESESSSTGFDQKTSISLTAGPLTAKTNIRNALIYGNSKTSEKYRREKMNSFTYTLDENVYRILYGIEIDWDRLNPSSSQWSDGVIEAVSLLGDSPSKKQLYYFFRDVGTHGLKKAHYGQKCQVSVFMKSGASESEYYEFTQKEKNNAFNYLWLSHGSQSSQTNSEEKQYESSFTYMYGNKYCHGEMNHGSSCDKIHMAANSINRPAIIKWSYMPIWEMNIPNFSAGAKQAMQIFFDDILESGYKCGENSCNGHGECAPNFEAWTQNVDFVSKDNFWDGRKCFCDDKHKGNACEIKRSIILLPVMQWTHFINGYKDTLEYDTEIHTAICGIGDRFHSRHRKFKFLTCDTQKDDFHWMGAATYGLTRLKKSWELNCDSDKVMSGLTSYFDWNKRDRRWKIRCRKLRGLTTKNCKYTIKYEIYYGTKDGIERISKCPKGRILHGLKSLYSLTYNQRKFKIRCCELTHENSYRPLIPVPWSSWQNGYRTGQQTNLVMINDIRVFYGIHSFHDNANEDRIIQFRALKPNGYGVYRLKTVSWTPFTTANAHWNFECPLGSFITGWKSEYLRAHKDRKFSFECSRYSKDFTDETSEDDCVWTPYANDFDKEYWFHCGEGQAINGVNSYYSPHHHDRRFKFHCCRLKYHT